MFAYQPGFMTQPESKIQERDFAQSMLDQQLAALCSLVRHSASGDIVWPRLINWREKTHALVVAGLGDGAGKKFTSLCMSFYENGHEPTFNEIAARYCLALNLLKDWIASGETVSNKVSHELLTMLHETTLSATNSRKFNFEKFVKVTLGVFATLLADVVTKMFF